MPPVRLIHALLGLSLAVQSPPPAAPFVPLDEVALALDAVLPAQGANRAQALQSLARSGLPSPLRTLSAILQQPSEGGSCKYVQASDVDYSEAPARTLGEALANAEYVAMGAPASIRVGFVGSQVGTLVTLQLIRKTSNLPDTVDVFLPSASFAVDGQRICVGGSHAPLPPQSLDELVFLLIPKGRSGQKGIFLPASDLEFVLPTFDMLPLGYPHETQLSYGEFKAAFERELLRRARLEQLERESPRRESDP